MYKTLSQALDEAQDLGLTFDQAMDAIWDVERGVAEALDEYRGTDARSAFAVAAADWFGAVAAVEEVSSK